MGLFGKVKNAYSGSLDVMRPQVKKKTHKTPGGLINTAPVGMFYNFQSLNTDIVGVIDKIAYSTATVPLSLTYKGDTVKESDYFQQINYYFNNSQTFTQYLLEAVSQAVEYGISYSYIEKNELGRIETVTLLKHGDVIQKKYSGNEVFYSVESIDDDVHSSQMLILNLKNGIKEINGGVHTLMRELSKLNIQMVGKYDDILKVKNEQSVIVTLEDTFDANYGDGMFADADGYTEEVEEVEDNIEFVEDCKNFVANNGGVLVEEDGRKYRVISGEKQNAIDFATLDKFIRTKIAILLNVPIQMLAPQSGSRQLEVDEVFTKNVILPYLRIIEDELNRKLLNQESRTKGYLFKFQTVRLLVDMNAQLIQSFMRSGIATQNEMREILGFSNIGAEGDRLFVSRDITGEEEATLDINNNGGSMDEN